MSRTTAMPKRGTNAKIIGLAEAAEVGGYLFG
ncbi:MAG: hypothetical protein JWM51_2229, partial [Microbacteriaceae bacterium]|nr:hypothetical protein [Microbacteriaceae bacterium]